jgi:transposase InsO family protein
VALEAATGQTVRQLGVQLEWFRGYYNTERPHRALGRRTPLEAFEARLKAAPPKARSTPFWN